MARAEVERCPLPAHEALCEHGDTALVGCLDQDGELVATEPGHTASTGHDLHQPVAHRLEDGVAGRVTQAVVDGLETVEIHHEQRQRLTVLVVERPPQPLLQQLAVGQAGE